MPQIVSGIWGKVRTDDILDRAVTRAKLEYPTEDVTFAYLGILGKVQSDEGTAYRYHMLTLDSFTDKAVKGYVNLSTYYVFFVRYSDSDNFYELVNRTGASTADFCIEKVVGGTSTTLATESVDLSSTTYLEMFSVSGSTLKAFRSDMTTPKLTATDTDLTSGYVGFTLAYSNNDSNGNPALHELKAPATQLPKPLAIIECEITGKGTEEDPIRPQLPQDLRDPKELGLNLNKPQINLKSVTWGAIDYKGGNTMIIAIYKHGADYLDPKRFEDVLAIAKNKWKVPSNVQEAEQLHKELRKVNPDMIAGKHTVAYHLLGDENIEPCSVADFYHGNMIEDNKIKGVPEWELRRTLLRWKDRLERARINAELKDNHLKKLNECLKK